MTPEEKEVIRLAERWAKQGVLTEEALRLAVQRLKISRRPAEGPEPIPCMVFANNSATMFCIQPKGHEGSEPDRLGASKHVGYGGGDPKNGRRLFKYWPDRDTMEGHERPACARFPGCVRHPVTNTNEGKLDDE